MENGPEFKPQYHQKQNRDYGLDKLSSKIKGMFPCDFKNVRTPTDAKGEKRSHTARQDSKSLNLKRYPAEGHPREKRPSSVFLWSLRKGLAGRVQAAWRRAEAGRGSCEALCLREHYAQTDCSVNSGQNQVLWSRPACQAVWEGRQDRQRQRTLYMSVKWAEGSHNMKLSLLSGQQRSQMRELRTPLLPRGQTRKPVFSSLACHRDAYTASLPSQAGVSN
jgi:hypothetical protein